jgi:hypothetical protein
MKIDHSERVPGPSGRWAATRLVPALIIGAGLVLVAAEGASAAPTPSPRSQLAGLRDTTISSVVAPNGDKMPFGIALVPSTASVLTPGDVLVTDFADKSGTAGAGSTILDVNPTSGHTSVFASGGDVAGPVALALNQNGIVWSADYGAANAKGVFDGTQSNYAVILPTGTTAAAFTNANTKGAASFEGLWGAAVSVVNGKTSFYWGNAGNATTGTGGGDVWRVDPNPAGVPNGQPINSAYERIATGLGGTPAGGNAASAAGPQGMAFDPATGTLYVTSDADNSIVAIPNAATATGLVHTTTILKGGPLHSPEGLVINPTNGDLLVVNGASDNHLIELTNSGQVVAVRNLARHQAPGALFGLAATTSSTGHLVIYYTNGDQNTLHQLTTP